MNPAGDHDGRTTPQVNAQALAGAVVGLAGYGVAGAEGAALSGGLAPFLSHFTLRAWMEVSKGYAHSVDSVITQAADVLGTDPDDLVVQALAREESQGLLADALFSASRTLNQRKVAALAKAVANGLRDDMAHIDQQRLIVRALATVEEPHIKVLLAFVNSVEMTNTAYSLTAVHHKVQVLTRDATSHVITTLEAAGLVAADVNDKRRQEQIAERKGATPTEEFLRGRPLPLEETWSLTPFGLECLNYLRESGSGDST